MVLLKLLAVISGQIVFKHFPIPLFLFAMCINAMARGTEKNQIIDGVRAISRAKSNMVVLKPHGGSAKLTSVSVSLINKSTDFLVPFVG
jgi:hypothetical protein